MVNRHNMVSAGQGGFVINWNCPGIESPCSFCAPCNPHVSINCEQLFCKYPFTAVLLTYLTALCARGGETGATVKVTGDTIANAGRKLQTMFCIPRSSEGKATICFVSYNWSHFAPQSILKFWDGYIWRRLFGFDCRCTREWKYLGLAVTNDRCR